MEPKIKKRGREINYNNKFKKLQTYLKKINNADIKPIHKDTK